MYMKNINGWWVNMDTVCYIRPDTNNPKDGTIIHLAKDDIITVPWPMEKVLAVAGITDRNNNDIIFDDDDNDIK